MKANITSTRDNSDHEFRVPSATLFDDFESRTAERVVDELFSMFDRTSSERSTR